MKRRERAEYDSYWEREELGPRVPTVTEFPPSDSGLLNHRGERLYRSTKIGFALDGGEK